MCTPFPIGKNAAEDSNVPEFIIVHESDSSWGTPKAIDEWHRARGFRAIGYHYVIGNAFPTYAALRRNEPDDSHDGLLMTGRDLDGDSDIDEEIGAHCPGYNSRSIGVCLIGKNGRYSDRQIATLHDLLEGKCRQYGIGPAQILGHCETKSGKLEGKRCPSLPMRSVRAAIRSRLGVTK